MPDKSGTHQCSNDQRQHGTDQHTAGDAEDKTDLLAAPQNGQRGGAPDKYDA